MHTNEIVGGASDHPGQTQAAPGDPQNSVDSDSNSGDRSQQLWNRLFDSAMDLVDCEDPVPLVLEDLGDVRKQAAEIVRELWSFKRQVLEASSDDSSGQHGGGKDARQFNAISQQMANWLLKLVTEAHRIASKNHLTTLEYWKDSDRPQGDFQGALDSLCESLEEFGLEAPNSEERRIRDAAFKMLSNRHLLGI